MGRFLPVAAALIAAAASATALAAPAIAPIVVRTPAAGATVSNPVRLAGTADVFEATFQLEAHAGGRLISKRTIHATSGTGTRGTWSATLRLPAGNVTLVLYEASAKDGSRIHIVRVPVHVR
jgi:Immunoglobulin-like domain of bacterial spore germination